MNNPDELILKYFEDSLTEPELATFDDLMKSDPGFKESVEFRRKIKLALQNKERKNLKDFLIQVENDIQDAEPGIQPPTSRPLRIWPFMAAAMIALAVIATFVIKDSMFNSDAPFSQDFYAYYEPYPNVVTPITRGEHVNPEELEKAAFSAYESGDFIRADSIFIQLLTQQKEYLLFYRGIAKIELEQYDSAKLLFEKYLYSDGMQFRDQAKWYLALSYLVKGDTISGKEELIKLRKSSGYKMEEVERILLNLD